MGEIKHASYNQTIKDGSPPVDPSARVGEFAVVGHFSAGSNGDIKRVNGATDFETELGDGALRNFCEQYFAETNKKSRGITLIYADPSSSGANDTVANSGDGPAATVAGDALWYVEPVVKVTTGGAVGTAQVAVSLDNGEHYADPVTVPDGGEGSGEVVLHENLGLTMTFTTSVADLVEDDEYSFAVLPSDPEMGDADTAGSVHKAIADYFLTTVAAWPEMIHIEVPLAVDDIAALNTLAETRLGKKRAVIFTCLDRRIDWQTDETLDEYVAALSANFAHASVSGKKWVGRILGYETMLTYDGDYLPVSPAGAMYGNLSRLAKLSDSAGVTKNAGDVNVLKSTVITGQFTAAQRQALNELGGSLIRQHDGATGWYFTRMGTCASTSQYQALDRVRVMIYAIAVVFAKLFPFTDQDLDGEDATAMEPKTLSAMLTAYLEREVGVFVAAAVAEVIETTGDNLTVDIQLQPRRKASEINVGLAMVERITIGKGDAA